VKVRYLYQVLRGLAPQSVFAQILLGFELAKTDPRFVGLNLVMPEDWYVPMHDFELHMKMLDYLHSVYPKIHIGLHAGELAMGLVPPDGLSFHIRESVERGHAERIDEGVSRSDMTHEYLRATETYHLPYTDLKKMARQSLEHSFLPGASIWSDFKAFRSVAACANDSRGGVKISDTCEKFLKASERARVQWDLEREFAEFERKY